MPFSIEQYKRKLQVRAAQAGKRGPKAAAAPSAASSSSSVAANADFVFDGLQKRYLDFCVDKTLNPDHKLLASLKTRSFVLKLDTFSSEELALHMEFLKKTAGLHHIALSLSSAAVNRDVRKKFERLGLSTPPARSRESSALIVRSICAACGKSPSLRKLQLRGITIADPSLASLISEAIATCDKLEIVNLGGTSLGDRGIEALSTVLGRRPQLLYLNLSECKLSANARTHIAKIMTLHGTLRDEAAWSSSLRGATTPSEIKRPRFLLDLSHNALGDAGVEAICSVLYHDKWVLGLNLTANQLTFEALKQCQDTLTHSNSTLSVLKVSDVSSTAECESIVRIFDSYVLKRIRHLRAVSAESNEKRLLLCNLLLEWNVNQDVVLRLCDDSMDRKVAGISPAESLSNQESELITGVPNGVRDATDSNHINTIKFLVDRLSAMEAEQQKTAQLVERLEDENHELRTTIKALSEKSRGTSPQALEESVIAQLEHSITLLANQIEVLEYERSTRGQQTTS